MKRENKSSLLFSIIVVVLIAIALFSLQNVGTLYSNSKMVAHTYKVKEVLANNLSILKDVQTGIRGFVISGDTAFLEPYNSADSKFKANSIQLRKLSNDNPIQQKNIDTLEQISRQSMLASLSIVNTRKQLGFNAAIKLVSTQKGKKLMDRVRVISSRMQEIEEGLLDKRNAITESSYNRTQVYIILGSIISIIIVLSLMYSIRLASRLGRKLTKSEAMFSQILEIAPDGIVVSGHDRTIQMVNSKTEKLFGYSRKEMIGKKIGILIPASQQSFFSEPQYLNMGLEKELILKRKDKSEVPVEIKLNPFQTMEGSDVLLVTIHDITERNKITNELIDSKNKAERATEIAESALKSKQQFLSNMSHEIRTPMNAIVGFTKVLLKTDFTDKQKEYLQAIKISGDALIVLINDILDLAKVNSGKMAFEKRPFKLALSISSVLHLFELEAQEKNLKLVEVYDTNIPEILEGDSVRLHQIIVNLMSNAIKFTTNGEITVAVNLLKEDIDKVSIEFAITDTGIGITNDNIELIFKSFQQATSSTSRIFGGTGLGLAIAKQLVEKQGGTMSVKSKLNEGSTFSFILSFQKNTSEVEQVTTNEELTTEIESIKVLVAEDMALNQLLIRTILDDFKFENDIAENGKIAIEKLKTKSYDIILMDLQMPEMNGFEATEYIRTVMNSNIPIIALTADVATMDLAKCMALGMNDFLAKPIDERLLYRKIVGLLTPNHKAIS